MNATLISQQRRQARDLYRRGRLPDAIALLGSVVEATENQPSRSDHALLGLYHFTAGDPLTAAQVMTRCHRLFPEDLEVLKNIGVCLSRAGRHAEAKPWLLQSVARDPEDANLHDALANVLGQLGDRERALHHGARALLLKDRIAACQTPAADPTDTPVPPFDEARPAANVIAFSLWGSAERYIEGALANARLAPHIYPGWRCRFYCEESVCERAVAELLAAGADVVRMPPQSALFEGLFWRFLVAFDPSVERYLVRDADAVISIRERLAVDEWLESGKHFHIIRDNYTHTDLILAGLWGGVRGALPDLTPLFPRYLEESTKTANCDQKFLREAVWPIARRSSCLHDSHYRILGARPFPEAAKLPQGRHVGEDASTFPKPALGRWVPGPARAAESARRRFVFTITTGRSGTRFLTELLAANAGPCECHHERTGFERFGSHTPDASTFTLFNSRGNVREVRDFWRRKFSLLGGGEAPCYIETSHFLAKAGLIENLAMLGDEAEVDVIDLRRDPFDIVWSYANRFGFANSGFTWLFALDPDYPRRIVDPTPMRAHGMYGNCLWYVAEIFTRADYYRCLMKGRPNVRFHGVRLEEITRPQGAASLLRDLRLLREDRPVTLPAKVNQTRAWALGEHERAKVKQLVEAWPFDSAALAEQFLGSGRRLA